MQWNEIRRTHPSQWLLVEALAAHSAGGKRIVEDLAIVGTYSDGTAAMNGYKALHRREPGRELYVLHTDREVLDIGEIRWLGIRTGRTVKSLEKATA